MGLGTVHVGVWMYLSSIFVGVLLSSLVVLAYTQRHRNPHQQLRTTEHLHLEEYEDTREYYARKCQFAGLYVVYLMGVCIPGSAFYGSSQVDREGGGRDHSPEEEYTESLTVMSRIWCTVYTVWQSVSSRRGNTSGENTAENTDAEHTSSSGIHNMLQSVRDSSSAEQRKHSLHGTSSYAHTSMSPQEYRELTPRQQFGPR